MKIDIEVVKRRATVPAVLAAHGMSLLRRGPCPIHRGDNRTAFAHGDEWWHCYTRCGGGDVIALVQAIRGGSFRDALTWLAVFCGLDVPGAKVSEDDAFFPDIEEPARASMLADIARRWQALVDQRDELDMQIDELDVEWRQALGSREQVVVRMLKLLTEEVQYVVG